MRHSKAIKKADTNVIGLIYIVIRFSRYSWHRKH